MKKFKWLFMLLLAVTLLLGACSAETASNSSKNSDQGTASNDSGTSSQKNGDTQKVLHMAMQAEPPVLDPQVSTDSYSIIVNNAIRR